MKFGIQKRRFRPPWTVERVSAGAQQGRMVTVTARVGTASTREVALVDLLASARTVELDDLHVERVVEVGHRGIVEGQYRSRRCRGNTVEWRAARRERTGRTGPLGPPPLEVVSRLRACRYHDPLTDPALEAGGVVRATPRYSSMWNTIVSAHGTSAVSSTRTRTNSSCEFPVANMAWASPRARPPSQDGGRLVRCGPAMAARSRWTCTVVPSNLRGPGSPRRQHASTPRPNCRSMSSEPIREVAVPGPQHLEAAWTEVRRT